MLNSYNKILQQLLETDICIQVNILLVLFVCFRPIIAKIFRFLHPITHKFSILPIKNSSTSTELAVIPSENFHIPPSYSFEILIEKKKIARNKKPSDH